MDADPLSRIPWPLHPTQLMLVLCEDFAMYQQVTAEVADMESGIAEHRDWCSLRREGPCIAQVIEMVQDPNWKQNTPHRDL